MQKRLRITARDNEKLKLARRIRDGKEPGEFVLVEGIRLCEDVLAAGISIKMVFVDPAIANEKRIDSLLKRLDKKGAMIIEVEEKLLRTISDTANPQGIAMIAERRKFSSESVSPEDLLAAPAPAFYFYGVNNPLNIGAAIRSAAAAGSPAIFISPNGCNAFSSKSNRAAMGANFRIPVFENFQISDALKICTESGCKTAAAVLNAEVGYTEIDWRSVGMVVFGSEAHGLDKDFLKQIPLRFTIPMLNGVESLNLAVTAGVVAFEARRQRKIA